ncbi:MAG: hypothetical protein LBG15_14320 [Dysgonamonadaceae bacterium]|jgi:hypothetical protein|nr:hypothetical protein [Dysgonamonadaceae bacterium]
MIDFSTQICILCGGAGEDEAFYQKNEMNRRLIPKAGLNDELGFWNETPQGITAGN